MLLHSIGALLLCAGAPSTTPSAHAEVVLYVSPHGDDGWTGRAAEPAPPEGPYRTLERARDELRRLRRQGELPGSASVVLREGVYPRLACFALDERDSGAATTAHVTYRAAAGEQVRITGSLPVPPQAFEAVRDPAILGRLPAESHGHVLQVDLPSLGISPGEMRPRGFARPYTNPALELFQDDSPLTLARWPNDDVVPIGEVLDRGSVPRDGDASGRGATFRYDYDRADRWTHARDIWLSGLFCYGFADDTLPVARFDTAARTVSLALPHLYGVSSGTSWRAYYVTNLLEEIDQPGEWYVDRATGLLYVWPPAPVERSPLYISALDEPLIALEGASFVTLQGLTLEMTRGMGVYIEGGADNLIAGCTVRNIGTVGICFGQGARTTEGQMAWGIAAEKGLDLPPVELTSRDPAALHDYIYANTTWDRQAGTGHGVLSCDIYNTGAGGVILGGGDRTTLTPGGNFVRNCHIHHYSRLDRTYRPAVYVDGVGNRVTSNRLHDASHTAILLHGNDHIIEHNEIYQVCLDADDMGAFYMGRDPSEQGIVLRNNYFHHNGSGHAASCSVYLDDGACGALVQGNVFYRQIGQPIWINGGHDHVFEGNLFIECGGAWMAPGMDNAAWANYLRDPLQVRRLTQAVDITRPPYSERYPGLADEFITDPAYPRGQTIRHNISLRSGTFTEDRNTLEGNLVISEDPGFVSAREGDFTLRPESPVFNAAPGFAPIPFREIGLQLDEFRHELPRREITGEVERKPRDPATRYWHADFEALRPGGLPGQGGWRRFGPGPDLRIGKASPIGAHAPGLAAVATGLDSWACIDHGIIIDPERELVLELDTLLPAPLNEGSSFELYLNREGIWSDGWFGVSLQGGAEEGVADCICVRQDSGGRILSDDRIAPDRWYRLRLSIAPGSTEGRVTVTDLSGGEPIERTALFRGQPTVSMAAGSGWNPAPAELDTVILRLGGRVQVAGLRIVNE